MSSISNPPPKIALSSSTKISLNDRFTNFSKTVQQIDKMKSSDKSSISLTSDKNRNLATKMANKPNFQAALRIKKKSIHQKLRFKAGKKTGSRLGRFDTSRLSGSSKKKPSSLGQRLKLNKIDIKSIANLKPSELILKRINNNKNSSGLNTLRASEKLLKRIDEKGRDAIKNSNRIVNRRLKISNSRGRNRANERKNAIQGPKTKKN